MSEILGERSPLAVYGVPSLRRRWRLIVACGLTMLSLGLAFHLLQPKRYTSSSQFLVFVRKFFPGPDPIVVGSDSDLVQVENEIEVIRSRGSLAKVAKSLKLADDPEIVQARAPFWFLSDFLSQAQTVDDKAHAQLERAIDFLEKHIAIKRVGTSHTILLSVTTSSPRQSVQIADAIGAVAVQSRVGEISQGDGGSLLLRERLQGLGPSIYTITAARAPNRPDGPGLGLMIGAAMSFGLLLGAALAILMDFFDRKIRTAAQVEHFGLECIGAVPRFRNDLAAASERLLTGRDDEAERQLDAMADQTMRRALAAIGATRKHTIGITSAVAGEGVTSVARQLAQMANACGRRTRLVEACWGGSPEGGYDPHFASRTIDPRVRADNGDGFEPGRVDADLPDGGWRNGARRAPQATPIANADYDLCVMDLPPLDRGPAFRLVAKQVDALLLVVRWGETEFCEVERALAESGVPLSNFVGAIVNMVDDQMIGKFGDKLWKAEAALAAAEPLGVCEPA